MVEPFLPYGHKTYVMGILNITPDSFSGDGLLSHSQVVESAVEQALRFIEAGADILDIGGESTRPGAAQVSATEEQARVLPVIEALAALHLQTLLSVDTYKAAVAEAALRAGAHWINDVWGLCADPDMPAVAARFRCPVVLMHNRSQAGQVILHERLGGQYLGPHYTDFMVEVKADLLELVHQAEAAGVQPEQIILDPGVGFGKSVEQNLQLVDQLDDIKELGFPVLLGPSRKSFIGMALNLPADQRLEGTAAVCAIGIARGADILRVHDVETIVRTARMADAIVRR